MTTHKRLLLPPIFTILLYPLSLFAAPLIDSDTLNVERFITQKNLKATRLREGVFVTVHTEGVGKMPKTADFVKVAYTGRLLDGRVFDATPAKEPFAFQIGGNQVVKGLEIALSNLSVGTKATVFLDAPMAYGALGIGDVIPPNTPISYDIEVVEILTEEKYKTILHELDDRMRQDFIIRMANQFELEKKHIQDYALLHRIRTKRTENGISYMITKQGAGDSVRLESTVKLNFEARLLNDKVFVSTQERGAQTFHLGKGELVAGLEDALRHFPQGSEGWILIPSKYGYGSTTIEDGSKRIPANSVLIYKVEVVEVRNPSKTGN
jgi:FKBP-type peptidyl-prolyl cis-trans isomerase